MLAVCAGRSFHQRALATVKPSEKEAKAALHQLFEQTLAQVGTVSGKYDDETTHGTIRVPSKEICQPLLVGCVECSVGIDEFLSQRRDLRAPSLTSACARRATLAIGASVWARPGAGRDGRRHRRCAEWTLRCRIEVLAARLVENTYLWRAISARGSVAVDGQGGTSLVRARRVGGRSPEF